MLDTVVTAAGFVVVLFGVVLAFGCAPFFLMVGDAVTPESPRRKAVLVYVLVAVPPLAVLAVYVGALTLAILANGPTYYYPWAATAVGGLVWCAIVAGIGEWHKRVN